MKTLLSKWLLLTTLALIAGCGFHLRGTGSGASMPESLWVLRVMQDSKLANDPLLVTMKAALQADPNLKLSEDPQAPTLVLFGEKADSQVLSVSSSGRASGYVLKYEVSFKLTGPKGVELQPQRTVRLIREYTFDPLNVLAKEQEEQDLKRNMQRDAVQQIIRRLARYTPPKD